MDIYVKEALYVLDYNGNIKDMIFVSDDHMTPGYAYDINIKESNMGYSDLTFKMPSTILDTDTKGAAKKPNPKLKLVYPLVRLRYARLVQYMGEETITVREPQGYGDHVEYVDRTYAPLDVMENYVMDFIVQPVEQKRDGFATDPTFTAIDYPRFTLSKKRVGLTIDNTTLTKPEWSLYQNKPLNVPGQIYYQEWTQDLINAYGGALKWDPMHATEYPLTKTQIQSIINNNAMAYGVLATAFYWPVEITGQSGEVVDKVARYKGQLYENGDFIVLQIYDLYQNSTSGLDPELHTERYAWEWTKISAIQPLLCPNNARNYLSHILNGTGWIVGTVDIEQKTVYNPDAAIEAYRTDTVDNTASISISNGNCYNAISATAKALQLYPSFDCVQKVVNLRVFNGANYGLSYYFGSNINTDTRKRDGEKVITKMYVSGGKDYNGDANINIGTANREYVKRFSGYYTESNALPRGNEVEGMWAIVDPNIQVDNETGELITPWIVEDYEQRQLYFYDDGNDIWSIRPESVELKIQSDDDLTYVWQTPNHYRIITLTYEDPDTHETSTLTFHIDMDSGMALSSNDDWDPNADDYISNRSPYGVNYILNFKWMYDMGWMTKSDILDIYSREAQIDALNKGFIDEYQKNKLEAEDQFKEATNNYDIAEKAWQSGLNSLMNEYHYDKNNYAQGTFRAFAELPGVNGVNWSSTLGGYIYQENGKYYLKMPDRGGYEQAPIYLPVYNDFSSYNPEPVNEPYIKGLLVSMIKQMDTEDDINYSNFSYNDYLHNVSLVNKIIYGNDVNHNKYPYYFLGANSEHIWIRSSSGQIDSYNRLIDPTLSATDFIPGTDTALAEGTIPRNHLMWCYWADRIDALSDRLAELQASYDTWAQACSDIRASEHQDYGNFFVEGNYTNDEQPYVSLLLNEGLEASRKYCVPELTYTVDVIDSSGLMEYRMPTPRKYTCDNCYYSDNKYYGICPSCGHGRMIKEQYIYNDLVRLLHSRGQIIPKAGDYCAVYDEEMGLYGHLALITDITRVLDNPINNKITLDTSYSDADDLVGNIINATNTVLNNKDIYARTAIINADGTLDIASIRNTLNNSNANISIVGSKGNMLLDATGLRACDPDKTSRALKYAGNGIFMTNNWSNDSDSIVWTKILSNDGIDANMVLGTLDARRVGIKTGQDEKVILDDNGLVVKTNASKAYHLTNLDINNALSWGDTNNIAAFVGTQKDGTPLVYVNGYLVAKNGSNIAGWVTDSHKIRGITSSGSSGWTPHSVGMSSSGWDGDPSFWAGYPVSGNQKDPWGDSDWQSKTPFYVTNTGKLKASNAEITGDITATNLTLSGNASVPAANISGTLTASQIDATNLQIAAGNVTGQLTANQINTTNLHVDYGNVDNISITDAQINSLSVGKLTGGSNSSSITLSNLTASGGKIGQFNITSGGIKRSSSTGNIGVGLTKTGFNGYIIDVSDSSESKYTTITYDGIVTSGEISGIIKPSNGTTTTLYVCTTLEVSGGRVTKSGWRNLTFSKGILTNVSNESIFNY